jgi:hypothetical protein
MGKPHSQKGHSNANAGAGTGAASTSSAREMALSKDLALWRKAPNGMALIESQSELYANSKKDDPDNTFVEPIIAAFSSGGSVDETMKLLEMIAAVSKDPEPEPLQIFKVLTDRFPLARSISSFLPESAGNGLVMIHKAHDLAEYLQLPKTLCLRLMQCATAEGYRQDTDVTVAEITGDVALEPLYKGALFYISNISVPVLTAKASGTSRSSHEQSYYGGYIHHPQVAASDVNAPYSGGRCELRLETVLAEPMALAGAFNFPPSKVGGLLGCHFSTLACANLWYLLGQSLGQHPLNEVVLASVESQVSMAYNNQLDATTRGSIASVANLVIECMAVMGRVADVSTLVRKGGVKHSPFMKELAEHIGYSSFPGVST